MMRYRLRLTLMQINTSGRDPHSTFLDPCQDRGADLALLSRVRNQIDAQRPLVRRLRDQIMSPPAKTLVATAALLLAASAEAQLLPMRNTHMALSQQNLDMLHRAVTDQVHGKRVGTTAPWSNPASANSEPNPASPKTRSQETAMRGNRIHGALEGPARLHCSIISPAAYNRTGPGKSPDP